MTRVKKKRNCKYEILNDVKKRFECLHMKQKPLKNKFSFVILYSRNMGYFLENDFLTPPTPSNQFCTWILDMDIIDHVAAALGPLACPSRSARPRKCLSLT